MTRAPHTLESNRSVGAVLGMMREYGISHIPVMEGGKLEGMVSLKIFWRTFTGHNDAKPQAT